MIRFLIRLTIAVFLVSPAMSKPPVVHTEIGKTLNVARKKEKMGIFILGTNTCSFCRVLKRHIEEGEVAISADSFIMADLDSNDQAVRTAFFKQFGLDSKAEWKTPYVVITNASGKVLVTWNGGKKPPLVDRFVQEAKSKAGQ